MKLSKELARKLLRQMYLTRAFEEQAERSYMEGKVHGTMHPSARQVTAKYTLPLPPDGPPGSGE